MPHQRVDHLARVEVDHLHDTVLSIRVTQIVLLSTPHTHRPVSPVARDTGLENDVAPRRDARNRRIRRSQGMGVKHGHGVRCGAARDDQPTIR